MEGQRPSTDNMYISANVRGCGFGVAGARKARRPTYSIWASSIGSS